MLYIVKPEKGVATMDINKLKKSFMGMATAVGVGLLNGTAMADDTPDAYAKITDIEQGTKTDGGKAVPDGAYLAFTDPDGQRRHISIEDLLTHSSPGKVPMVIEHERIEITFPNEKQEITFTP
jgi:expansin (peptidoglycan-binding protein)